jgi:hypothetical protein
LHTGTLPEHSVRLVALHCSQVVVTRLQAGRAPVQSASPVQPTQRLIAGLQTSTPVQADSLVVEHSPQAPLGRQAGSGALQSASLPQGRQLLVAVSHTGVVPPQSRSVRHATQNPVTALQTSPVAQAPVLLVEHWLQEPSA